MNFYILILWHAVSLGSIKQVKEYSLYATKPWQLLFIYKQMSK